ncbi:MAG: nucleotide pyrophosphohydrolase [Saprospiraceae bacterium]|nr:nucleotide pyrophosphohydrolase [Saprospiraceae bacterium]
MKIEQEAVDTWIKTYGIRYFNEMTNTVLLMEEVGELSRYIARIYGEQSFKNTEDQGNAKEHIKEELGDILFVLICLSNQMEIDLEQVFKDNLEKKTKRDFKRHLENIKLK